MRRITIIVAAAVLAAAGALGLAGLSASRAPTTDAARAASKPVWIETSWPFPVDPWGKGKAFRCKALDCGGEVHLYVRAKLGFCNCATGIADDADLDRMGDLELFGRQATPLGAGRPISVASMQGRARAYNLGGSQDRKETVISIAFNDRCDMVAATALVESGALATIEPAVMDLLNSARILKWVEATLGL